jgi:hypothetical protein
MINRLIVFIHGLGGDAASTWGKFPALLRADDAITTQYSLIESWEYSTGLKGVHVSLKQIAPALELFIESKLTEG